jgi:hypothetical protein
MAQQNSIRLACELTFKQNLYVYLIIIILWLFYVFRASNIFKLNKAAKMDNEAVLYKYLINKGLKFLPFWNFVSVI